jgi:hypothetical protein
LKQKSKWIAKSLQAPAPVLNVQHAARAVILIFVCPSKIHAFLRKYRLIHGRNAPACPGAARPIMDTFEKNFFQNVHYYPIATILKRRNSRHNSHVDGKKIVKIRERN